MWGHLLVLLVVAVSSVTSEQEYCNLKCDQHHSMCKYQNKPAARCGTKVGNYMYNDTLKIEVIDAHNYYRLNQTVAGIPPCLPPAAHMENLTWDGELASLARRWAMQCNLSRDPCRIRKDGTAYGQNIYWLQGDLTRGQAAAGVDLWFNQHTSFPPSLLEHYQPTKGNATTEDYTQLVWAKTTSIGCESIRFRGQMYLLVCNYWPVGNIFNETVYKTNEVNFSQCNIDKTERSRAALTPSDGCHVGFLLTLALGTTWLHLVHDHNL